MKLTKAKLCVACEEVHDQGRCPVCGEEQAVWIVHHYQTLPKGRVRMTVNNAENIQNRQ